MTRISERYPHNGIYKFENFVENALNDEDVFRVQLNSSICNHRTWYLMIKTATNNQGIVTFCPKVTCDTFLDPHQEYIRTDLFCKIINNKDDSDSIKSYYRFRHVTRETCMSSCIKMTIPEVMDENNGWLENGALSVELGIYVEFIQWKNGIRSFNFYDRTFECEYDFNMITMEQQTNDKRLYSHKQLMTFHSPRFCISSCDPKIDDLNISNNNYVISISEKWNMNLFEKCLQIAHGVHLKPSQDIALIIIIAQSYELTNVVRYCERTVIENEIFLNFYPTRFQFALNYKLHRLLNHILKSVSKLEDLKKMLNNVDMQKVSAESMKFIVRKILSDFC